MPSAFKYDPTINSSIGCKLYNYFAYGMDALSPWCLVYISFERFITTKYYAKRFLYKKKKFMKKQGESNAKKTETDGEDLTGKKLVSSVFKIYIEKLKCFSLHSCIV